MGKDDRKKVFIPQLFRPKVFDMDFPQKVFYGVFELPLLRNRKNKYVRTFFFKKYVFLVRFWAFLGKGTSKTRKNN
jgi:hypothetical protein